MELNPQDASSISTSNKRTWDQAREALIWFENKLQEPRVNCLEVWGDRKDLTRMRATTTLALTHSNGYVLYGDPNPLKTPDHLHDWYDFWDVPLGKPLTDLIERGDGAYQRNFEGGIVIYNHMGNGEINIHFDQERKRSSDGRSGKDFVLADRDGHIFTLVH